MRKLSVFNFVSMNGYFAGPGGDISWHKDRPADQEQDQFGKEGVQSDGVLIFGRKTYDMMASFWPTPMGMQVNPVMAEGMNKSDKIVFSKTMDKASWNNTTLIKDNAVEAMKNLKQQPGKPMTILGSGSIVTQLAAAGLIDEFQLMVDPVALGSGTPLFNGLQHPLELQLVNHKIFKSGVIVLTYQPAYAVNM